MTRRFNAGAIKRSVLSRNQLDETPFWPNDNGFLRLIKAESLGTDPAAFVRQNKTTITNWLDHDGACLLRGFDCHEAATFAATVAEFGTPLPYIERAAKRTEILPGVFTSTELAPQVAIPQHHEMSYSHFWPQRVYFWCDRPPENGGRTPLAPERKVSAALDPALKRKFEQRGLLYIRNFAAEGLDLSWSDTFGTRDREEVTRYAKEADLKTFWGEQGELRTTRRGPATVRYPLTGESLWFNHVHLFHPTNLVPKIRASLLAEFGPDALPRDVRYGNGEIIPDEEVLAIRNTYARHEISFEWQAGDLLFLNNFLVTHGRQAFMGERRVLVAMTGLHHLNEKT